MALEPADPRALEGDDAVKSDNKNPNTPIDRERGPGADAHASRDAPPAGRPPARATRRRRSDQTPIAYAACVTLSAVSDVLLVLRASVACATCASVAAQVLDGARPRVPRHAERGNVRVAGGHAAYTQPGDTTPRAPPPAHAARCAHAQHEVTTVRCPPVRHRLCGRLTFMRTSDTRAA